jgi:thioester reductase-like protein
LLPRFETITYAQVWDRVGAIAAAWTNDPVRPGDRVCVLGFTSMDYTAVQDAKIGPDKDIPHITAPLIAKYSTNLQLLGLL